MSKPFLWDTVNTLYHGVVDHLPEVVQERDIALPALLGFGGIYLVVKGLQWTSRHVMDRIIPNFDRDWLPALEKTCIGVIVGAPILYAIVDPEGAREIWTQNYQYTPGMGGVVAGSVTGAAQDLSRRSTEKALEDHLIE